MLLRESIFLGFSDLRNYLYASQEEVIFLPCHILPGGAWHLVHIRSVLNYSTFMMINIDSIPKKLDYMEPKLTSAIHSAEITWTVTGLFHSSVPWLCTSVMSLLCCPIMITQVNSSAVIYQGRFSSVGRNNETSSKGKTYYIPYQQ